MRIILLLLISCCGINMLSNAQGCVAIRGGAYCGGGSLSGGATLMKGEMLSNMSFRYFKSFRHFRGHEEEVNRVTDGTQVINHSYFLDLSLSYGITDRIYGNLILPFAYHSRSSMYEHGGNPPNGLGERHSTSSRGLSDIRFGLGYWLLDPLSHSNANYAVGIGIKLPTGSYDYTDTFYNQGSNRDQDLEAVVDQSIQLGDGGTGITLDIQGFQQLSSSFTITANLYYLVNPMETNGVLTRNGSSEFSVPDQFAARLGAYYNLNISGLSLYGGGRLEGVPSSDLIGGSAGYRRPGYAVSLEPGLSYSRSQFSVNIGVPISIVRNRTQSYEDKQRTQSTGVYRHGDAAFADYLINVGLSYRFGGAMGEHTVPDVWE